MKEIAAAFGTLSQEEISAIQAAEAASEPYIMHLASGDVSLAKGDYEISSEDMPGWLVATDGPLTVALDITVTDDLRKEGVARELINRIQNLRKNSGFDVTDKIDVKIFAGGTDGEEIAETLKDFSDYIAAQTLAGSISALPVGDRKDAVEVEWGDASVYISVSKK